MQAQSQPQQQQQQQQQQTMQQQGNVSIQRIDSPIGMSGSNEGVRQQQYIIVQTTGSNGLPTNLAVPASLVLSPQVLMDQHQNKGGQNRPNSAPPVQNHQHQIRNHRD